MIKKMIKKLALFFLVLLVIGFPATAHAASYYIDSIYDDRNSGDWLSETPTLVGGETYNVTIDGSGEEYPDSWAHMGLFVDWTGATQNESEWSGLTTVYPVLYGNDQGTTADGGYSYAYSVNGPLTVPYGTPTTDTLAFVGLNPGNDTANGGYRSAAYYYGGEANEFPTVHLEYAIPEPSSIFLLSFGLLGLAARRIFRKK